MKDTRTVKSAFNQMAQWHSERDAFLQAGSDPDRRYTYGEANEEARRFANTLANLGIGKGDTLAFLANPSVEHAVAFFGSLKIGAIPSAVHPREAPQVTLSLLEEVDPSVLIFDPAFQDLVEIIHEESKDIEEFMAFDQLGDSPDFAREYNDLVNGSPKTEPDTDVNPSDIAGLHFSSGTTGVPKVVVHTHEEYIECSHIGQYTFDIQVGDNFLNAFTPAFTGWHNLAIPTMNVGGCSVFLEQFDPAGIPKVVEEEQINKTLMVPTQFRMILQKGVGDHDLSSLNRAIYAGETMPKALFEEVREKLCENLMPVYASTETMTAGVGMTPNMVSEDVLDSVGRPTPNTDVRLIDPGSGDPEAEVESGEVGEAIIRAPSIAQEIWNDPERTRENFHPDGWWFSGDLARLGDDGNVRIEGRVDNMIISGGINIYAEGVEELIEEHPAIAESAVVSIPHEEWGEAVMAYFVPADDGVSIDELDEWCKENDKIGNYQRPRQWQTVKELPRTNTGKLDRASLREE
jgi:fatty-acyl-CoA synthase